VGGQEVDPLRGERRCRGQRDYQPCVRAYPRVHLVEVEGNDAASDQVEQVAKGVLLPEPDHFPGKQVPVHTDRDRDLGQKRHDDN
jgi:hypothetical protein